MAEDFIEKQFEKDDAWSDKECIRIAQEDNFPSAVRDLNVQKKIVNRFLNFYLGGRPPPGMSVYDLVYATISIMPLDKNTEEFIWPEAHYEENGTLFFLSAEEKLKADIQAVMAKRTSNESSTEKADSNTASNDNDQVKIQSKIEDENIVQQEAESVLNHENNTNFENFEDLFETVKETLANILVNYKELFDQENSANTVPIIELTADESFENSTNCENENCQPKKVTNEEQKERETHHPDKASIPKLPEKLSWYYRRSTTGSPEGQAQYRSFESADNSAFIISCNKLLQNWDSYGEARIFLKYFFGLIALTLMRATTKSYKHLVNTLSSEKYIGMLPTTALVSFRYMKPHTRCIKMSYRAFYKRGANIRIMFAKLVVNALSYIRSKRDFNPFLMAVLAHTSQYGMGLLSLVDTMRRIYDLNYVIEVSYCKDTADSWNRVIHFAKRHLSEPRPSFTVWWARLIDPDLFANLACPQNYPLAVILATFIELCTGNSNLWRSKWVTGARNERKEELEKYKDLGKKMYVERLEGEVVAQSPFKESQGGRLNADDNLLSCMLNDDHADAEETSLREILNDDESSSSKSFDDELNADDTFLSDMLNDDHVDAEETLLSEILNDESFDDDFDVTDNSLSW